MNAMFVVACDSTAVEESYGPYTREQADRVCDALNGGDWKGEHWGVRTLKLTPWEDGEKWAR